MLRGSCLCRGIRYEISGELYDALNLFDVPQSARRRLSQSGHAFAEASGIETKAEFRFGAKGKKGIEIDEVKPARLVSRTGRKLDSRSRTLRH